MGKTKQNFKAGMYLLETLTSGMYNEPLTIFREYIQNSVDSIDFGLNNNIKISKKVDIQLEPFNKKILIHDKGFGLSIENAEETLSSVGRSSKIHSSFRGFRGIGRLGGIAFSDKAIFRTKAQGEVVESVQVWDCVHLRHLLAEIENKDMPIDQLFNEVTNFYQINGKSENGSYFNVELEGVNSFRNYLFDINRVHNYLSQIAPVPFHPEEFSFSDEINKYLKENLNHYGTYEIFLNGEPVYKPYRDIIKITKKGHDTIIDINKFSIDINNEIVAYGWYGLRDELLGAISRGENNSGIRVRSGNILIGDAHLLDGCFREPRFNSYLIGEIHIVNSNLVPNGRRDDFVDNEYKTLFYNAIEREIGLNVSKVIREKSRKVSESKINPLSNVNDKQEDCSIVESGNSEEAEHNNSDKLNHVMKDDSIEKKAQKILSICKGCKNYNILLDEIKNYLKP